MSLDVLVLKLRSEHESLGSWDKVAAIYHVNKRYLWELVTKGIVPASVDIRVKLGLQAPDSRWWDVEL